MTDVVRKQKPKVAEISPEMLLIHEQIRKNVEYNTSGAEKRMSHLKCSKVAAEHLFRLKVYKAPGSKEVLEKLTRS